MHYSPSYNSCGYSQTVVYYSLIIYVTLSQLVYMQLCVTYSLNLHLLPILSHHLSLLKLILSYYRTHPDLYSKWLPDVQSQTLSYSVHVSYMANNNYYTETDSCVHCVFLQLQFKHCIEHPHCPQLCKSYYTSYMNSEIHILVG